MSDKAAHRRPRAGLSSPGPTGLAQRREAQGLTAPRGGWRRCSRWQAHSPPDQRSRSTDALDRRRPAPGPDVSDRERHRAPPDAGSPRAPGRGARRGSGEVLRRGSVTYASTAQEGWPRDLAPAYCRAPHSPRPDPTTGVSPPRSLGRRPGRRRRSGSDAGARTWTAGAAVGADERQAHGGDKRTRRRDSEHASELAHHEHRNHATTRSTTPRPDRPTSPPPPSCLPRALPDCPLHLLSCSSSSSTHPACRRPASGPTATCLGCPAISIWQVEEGGSSAKRWTPLPRKPRRDGASGPEAGRRPVRFIGRTTRNERQETNSERRTPSRLGTNSATRQEPSWSGTSVPALIRVRMCTSSSAASSSSSIRTPASRLAVSAR